MAAWRYFINWSAYHPQLAARERVLILGSGKHAVEIARAALDRPGQGFQIVGFVDDEPELVGKSLINPSVLGLTSELSELVHRYHVDRLVVAVEDRRGKFPLKELLELSLSRQVTIEEGTRFYERLTGKVGVGMARPSCFIFSDSGRHSNLVRRIRRAANVALAAVGLILSLPLMLLVAIAIKLDSPGPIFYTQERVGKGGRRFRIIKFRSMRVDAEQESGPKWAEFNDPRITRVGQIIRRLRLDELPQFINVLRGDMNFIGPRPERPEFVEKLSQLIPYYSQRHLVRPGLTGWAQINYHYGASIEDAIEKLQYDLYYIKNRSFLLDAVIFFETIKIVFFGRGAR
jgi:sugar transferase (PEP-CTERM system associated)